MTDRTPRKSMTEARRARVLAAFDGVCAQAGCEVRSPLQIDHTIPLELGGADDDHNLQPLCPPHHRAKTNIDIRMIAKARRIRARLDGTRRPRQKINGGGFQTKLTRGFDGKVRPKEKRDD